MAQPHLEDVLSHWSKLIENFNTDSEGFYTAVDAALERRRIHDALTRHIQWSEGGILSPNREYPNRGKRLRHRHLRGPIRYRLRLLVVVIPQATTMGLVVDPPTPSRDLVRPDVIGKGFAGFQKYLYQPAA
jgi:hypothetical protein